MCRTFVGIIISLPPVHYHGAHRNQLTIGSFLFPKWLRTFQQVYAWVVMEGLELLLSGLVQVLLLPVWATTVPRQALGFLSLSFSSSTAAAAVAVFRPRTVYEFCEIEFAVPCSLVLQHNLMITNPAPSRSG